MGKTFFFFNSFFTKIFRKFHKIWWGDYVILILLRRKISWRWQLGGESPSRPGSELEGLMIFFFLNITSSQELFLYFYYRITQLQYEFLSRKSDYYVMVNSPSICK